VSFLQRYILNLPKLLGLVCSLNSLLFARPTGGFLDRELSVFEECHQAVMGEVAHIDVAHGEFHPGRPPAFADGAMIGLLGRGRPGEPDGQPVRLATLEICPL
jgi:hypothetical protein